MPEPAFGEKETSYLAKKDKKLGALIERFGVVDWNVRRNLFESLVISIANQQISNKAAETVTNRMYEKFGEITPETVGAASAAEIQTVGISMKKAEYIKGLCSSVQSGELDLEALRALPDDEVEAKLLPIKGIGSWTVEMFLIFSLGRPDVLSYGDFAIRKGMMALYGLKELPREKFERYRKRYSPYGTIASLYLWRLSENG